MEHPTQETSIALLQQASVLQTATLVRIEGKVDRIEDVLQHYVTMDYLERNYVRKETLDSVSDKVKAMTWGLGIVFATVLGFIANTIFRFVGGK